MQVRQIMAAGAMALALGAMPALAENRGDGFVGQGLVPAIQAVEFGAIDSDGDGRISPEEWAAFIDEQRAAMRARNIEARVEMLFEIGDTDGDGQLSREELATAMAALQAERQAERAAWREARRQVRDEMRGQRRPRAEGERGARMQDRAGRAGLMAGPEQRAERMFQRIDTDGDGYISPEEFDAAPERWAQRFERMERRMEEGRARDGRGRANSAD